MKKYMVFGLFALILSACGGSGGSGGSSGTNSNPPNPNDPSESAAIRYTLPNGTIIYSPVNTLSVNQGESVTTTVAIYGGTPGLTINLGATIESTTSSSSNHAHKTDSGNGVTVWFTPESLTSGSMMNTSEVDITATPSSTPGVESVDLTATFSGETVTIGTITLTTNAVESINYGNISVNPQNLFFHHSGDTESLAVTLSGESNVSNLNLTITAASLDQSVVTVESNESCNFTQNGTCAISLMAKNPGTTLVTFTPSDESHYQQTQIGVTVSAQYAYVTTSDQKILMYKLTESSGQLVPLSPEYVSTGGNNPLIDTHKIAISPSGLFAYVTNANSISMYNIGESNGVLTPMSPESSINLNLATGAQAWTTSIDPAGLHAYVSLTDNFADGYIAVYDIDPNTGAFSNESSQQISTAGTDPGPLAINPANPLYAYVGDRGNGEIDQFAVDPVNGQLTTLASIQATDNPGKVAFDHTGNYAYFNDFGSTTIPSFKIQSNGQLLALTPVPANTYGSTDIVFHPTQNYLYTIGGSANGNIIFFVQDSVTGLLTQNSINPARSTQMTFPLSIVFDHTGSYAYVAGQDPNSIETYNFQSNGTLMPSFPSVPIINIGSSSDVQQMNFN